VRSLNNMQHLIQYQSSICLDEDRYSVSVSSSILEHDLAMQALVGYRCLLNEIDKEKIKTEAAMKNRNRTGEADGTFFFGSWLVSCGKPADIKGCRISSPALIF